MTECGIPDYTQLNPFLAALSYCALAEFPSHTLLLVILILPPHADVAADLRLADLLNSQAAVAFISGYLREGQ